MRAIDEAKIGTVNTGLCAQYIVVVAIFILFVWLPHWNGWHFNFTQFRSDRTVKCNKTPKKNCCTFKYCEHLVAKWNAIITTNERNDIYRPMAEMAQYANIEFHIFVVDFGYKSGRKFKLNFRLNHPHFSQLLSCHHIWNEKFILRLNINRWNGRLNELI